MELLIAITIIIVLAALVFVISKRAMKFANGARDVTTMRQVFTSIPLYAADNNGILPGPLNTGIKAQYGDPAKSSEPSKGRLGHFIAPYLGYEDLEADAVLPAMGYSWQKTDDDLKVVGALTREDVPLVPDGSETIKPFGRPQAKSGPTIQPMTMAAAFSQIDISRVWALSDVDQLHPDVVNQGWKKDVPEEMSHGNYRIAVYFDGHSGKLNKDNEPM